MIKFYLLTLLTFLSITLKAQKVPDIQNTSLIAPVNLRIDGKATEWGETLAADNKRTSLLYSLANDDKYLYFVIKGIGTPVINKIMAGGITFNINTEGKKKEKESFSVTYPLVKRVPRGQGGGRQGGGQARGAFGGGQVQNRTPLSAAQRDSASLVQHKAQLATVKEIKVSGFKLITDSLISIYNEYGLKTVASFDNNGAMIYELAIPLNLLSLSIDKPKEFAYQLKVNGLVMNGFNGGGGRGNLGNGGGRGGGGGFGGGGNFGGGNSMQDLMSPTDFWGKYTLIKN
ncbi:hypothetical protein [Pedobacter insulae]|uniref:Uncharacterized protein n=1 Tax=Pedobacter insulae TaxID=414048 RepID=A0A1I2ZH96_9SPHI|nr:hypothetical protein [Pedobacter insulae]SFH36869.1 hypothetical protein SAMN04489864_1108 [Pedobacter insulae]